MTTLSDIRKSYPQYSDMSDQQLADALYGKFYSDMPREKFDASIGIKKGKTYSGSILPLSKDEAGNVSFDSNAGIVGAVKRAFTGAVDAAALPGDVYSGKTQMYTDTGDLNPDVIKRSLELGALASPVSAATKGGEAVIPGAAKNLVKQRPSVPSASELSSAAKADYNVAKSAGVEIRGNSVANVGREIRAGLESDGIIAELAPKTHAIINKFARAPEGSIATIQNVEAIRRSLRNAAKDFNNPTEQLAASSAIKRMDSFLEALGSKDIVAGTPSTAKGVSDALKTARGNYAAAQRSNSITGELDRATTGLLERASGRAQSSNSGRNLDNTIRSKVQSVLEQPKAISGFSDSEIAALNEVVTGSPVRNTARFVGNRLGGGGGSMNNVMTAMGAGGGAMAGGVPGAILGAVVPEATGMTARTIANQLAKRSLNSADEIIRMNSPLFQQRMAAAPLIPENIIRDAAMARLGLLQAMNYRGE